MRLLEFFRPYHVVAVRRVSEEEQITVQVFHRTLERANGDLAAILATFRDHRREHNERVVKVARDNLTQLDATIEAKGTIARELDQQIEEKRAEASKLDREIKERRKRAGLDGAA